MTSGGLDFVQSDIDFTSSVSYWKRTVNFTAQTSGEYLVFAYAEDSSNLTSTDDYWYKLVIGVPAPQVVQSSLFPIGPVYLNASMTLNFTCRFTQIIKRAVQAAFIRLYDQNMTLISQLNMTMKRYAVIKNDTVSFTFGNILQPNKTYYISLDAGKFSTSYVFLFLKN